MGRCRLMSATIQLRTCSRMRPLPQVFRFDNRFHRILVLLLGFVGSSGDKCRLIEDLRSANRAQACALTAVAHLYIGSGCLILERAVRDVGIRGGWGLS